MTINDRLKYARIELGLKQVDVCKRIHISQGMYSSLEKNRYPVQDRTVKLFCSEFNINENWLRTGKGDMFVRLSRDAEIEAFVDGALSNENESFKRRFISVLSRLDDSGWKALAWFCQELYNEAEAEKQKRKIDPSKIDIDAEVAAYRAQLELQVQARGKSSASNATEDIQLKKNEA